MAHRIFVEPQRDADIGEGLIFEVEFLDCEALAVGKLGETELERFGPRGRILFFRHLICHEMEELIPKDMAITRRTLPMSHNLEVGDARGPRPEVAPLFKLLSLSPENTIRLLNDAVHIGSISDQGKDITAEPVLNRLDLLLVGVRGIFYRQSAHGGALRVNSQCNRLLTGEKLTNEAISAQTS